VWEENEEKKLRKRNSGQTDRLDCMRTDFSGVTK